MTRVLTTRFGDRLTDTDEIQDVIIEGRTKGVRRGEIQDRLGIEFTYTQWMTLRDFLKSLGYQTSTRKSRGKAWVHPHWFNKEIPLERMYNNAPVSSFKNLIPKDYFDKATKTGASIPKKVSAPSSFFKSNVDNTKYISPKERDALNQGRLEKIKKTRDYLYPSYPSGTAPQPKSDSKNIPTIHIKVPIGTRVVVEYE